MNSELCHYGVPGMKWGVRKSKEARYRDWKKRQHSRLDQQTSKDQIKWDKKIAKAKDRINVKGSTEARLTKLKTLEGKKNASAALNKIGHTHLDKLTQKDYDDVVKSQIYQTGISALSLAMMSTGRLPFGWIHIPTTDLNLEDYRVKHSDLESPDTIS